ncbi:hypothetical protein QJQ45_006064 [Haematococcus lacustris]|nr:hypothetical protein QJQ45_006064 [Haematococcus lacustris]
MLKEFSPKSHAQTIGIRFGDEMIWWQKVQRCAVQLGKGLVSQPSITTPNCQALLLRAEHWLEVADDKHRYGSNLRPYFDYYLNLESDGSAEAARIAIANMRLAKVNKRQGQGSGKPASPAPGMEPAHSAAIATATADAGSTAPHQDFHAADASSNSKDGGRGMAGGGLLNSASQPCLTRLPSPPSPSPPQPPPPPLRSASPVNLRPSEVQLLQHDMQPSTAGKQLQQDMQPSSAGKVPQLCSCTSCPGLASLAPCPAHCPCYPQPGWPTEAASGRGHTGQCTLQQLPHASMQAWQPSLLAPGPEPQPDSAVGHSGLITHSFTTAGAALSPAAADLASQPAAPGSSHDLAAVHPSLQPAALASFTQPAPADPVHCRAAEESLEHPTTARPFRRCSTEYQLSTSAPLHRGHRTRIIDLEVVCVEHLNDTCHQPLHASHSACGSSRRCRDVVGESEGECDPGDTDQASDGGAWQHDAFEVDGASAEVAQAVVQLCSQLRGTEHAQMLKSQLLVDVVEGVSLPRDFMFRRGAADPHQLEAQPSVESRQPSCPRNEATPIACAWGAAVRPSLGRAAAAAPAATVPLSARAEASGDEEAKATAAAAAAKGAPAAGAGSAGLGRLSSGWGSAGLQGSPSVALLTSRDCFFSMDEVPLCMHLHAAYLRMARWLDHGAGKEFDLGPLGGPPRGQLESQRVMYLTSQQLSDCLVSVDQSGRLVYHSTARLLHTDSQAAALQAQHLMHLHSAVAAAGHHRTRSEACQGSHVDEGAGKVLGMGPYLHESWPLCSKAAGAAAGEADHGGWAGDRGLKPSHGTWHMAHGCNQEQQQQQGQKEQQQQDEDKLQQQQQQQQQQGQGQQEQQQQQQQQHDQLQQQEQEEQEADGGQEPSAGLVLMQGAGSSVEASTGEEGHKMQKWIYVVDCLGRLYVHAKVRGHFHHSSFLRGGPVLAAGGTFLAMHLARGRHSQRRSLQQSPGSESEGTEYRLRDAAGRLRTLVFTTLDYFNSDGLTSGLIIRVWIDTAAQSAASPSRAETTVYALCYEVIDIDSQPKDYKPVDGQPFPFSSITFLVSSCGSGTTVDVPVTFLPTNNIIVPVEVPCSGSTATGAALRPASTFCETADQFAWMEYAESLALSRFGAAALARFTNRIFILPAASCSAAAYATQGCNPSWCFATMARYLAAALGWVGGGGSFALELALGGLSILLRLLLCAWLAREYWALNLWQLAVWLTGCMAAVGAGVGPPHGLQVDQVFFAPQS